MNESSIKINHATLKHAQTIGNVERNLWWVKQILQINVAADKAHWDRYLNLAIMAHNTTHHQSLKSTRTPTEVFHGRIPYNALRLKFSNPMQRNRTKVQLSTLIDEANDKCKDTIVNVFDAFHKYKKYYDRKAYAQPLKLGDYVLFFNPKYHTQSGKTQFKTFLWKGSYKDTRTLTHSNYIICKTGTQKTQCVHRMRLRRFIPHENVPDIQVDQQQFYQDPDTIDKPDLLSTHIPTNTLCQDQQLGEERDNKTENPQKTVIQLQAEANVPPLLIEQEVTMPATHSAPSTNPLSIQEDHL